MEVEEAIKAGTRSKEIAKNLGWPFNIGIRPDEVNLSLSLVSAGGRKGLGQVELVWKSWGGVERGGRGWGRTERLHACSLEVGVLANL